jgi:OFA family oxalate/formate antiporter-like MFS transporter
MAVMIASGGVSAALLGPWTVRAGARRAVATGAVCFGLGLAVSGLGVACHSLPLLYGGNVLCGLGYGCAYTPPLQTMLDWFPDRRGLAR